MSSFIIKMKKIGMTILLCLFAQMPVFAQSSDNMEEKNNNNNKIVEVLATGPKGQTLTVADILSEANKMPSSVRVEFLNKPDTIQQVVRNLMVRRMLAEEARKERMDQDGVTKAAIQVAQERILSDARIRALDELNTPEEKALEAYARNKYQANIDKFRVPVQTRASHILIEEKDAEGRQQAEEMIKRLKAGEKFEDLAKAYSKDPGSAARGGDLGFFGEGRMVKPFEDALKLLSKQGEISPPVETQFGYHIIRLDERKAATTRSFDEVKNQLLAEARAEILSHKRAQKVAELEAQIQLDRASIEQFGKEASQLFAPR